MQDLEREPTNEELQDASRLLSSIEEETVVYYPTGKIIPPNVLKYTDEDMKALELIRQRRISTQQLRKPVAPRVSIVELSSLQVEMGRVYNNKRRLANSPYYIRSMCDNMRERIEMGYTVHFGERIYFVPPKRFNHA
jgi:hypothetical protein